MNEREELCFTRSAIKSAIKSGFMGAFAMLASGFVTLNVFWFAGSYDTSVPGLYDYYAATWGDGLFLTLGAGGFRMLQVLFPIEGAKKRIAMIVGSAMFLAGAAIQLSWLCNPDIALNWTIPRVGCFNAAGWYHAFYFSACFGFFGFSITAIILVKSTFLKESVNCSAVAIARLLVWIALAGYLQMHLLDDWVSRVSQPWLAFYGVLATIVLCAAYALLRHDVTSAKLGVCAALFACGFSLVTYSSFQISVSDVHAVTMVALLLLFSFRAIFCESESLIAGLLVGLLSSLGVLFIGMEIVTFPSYRCADPFVQVLVCLLVAFLAVCVAPKRPVSLPNNLKYIACHWMIVADSLILMSCFNSLIMLVDSSELLSFIGELPFVSALFTAEWVVAKVVIYATLLTAMIGLAAMKMGDIRRAEQSVKGKTTLSRRLLWMKRITFCQILVGSAAGFLVVVTDAHSLGWTVFFGDLAVLSSDNVLLIVGAVFACTVALAIAILAHDGFAGRLAVPCIAVAYVLLFSFVTELRRPLEVAWWWAISLFPLIGSALFVTESFLSNAALLHRGACSPQEASLGAIIAAGSFVTAFGATMPTEGAGREFLPTVFSLSVGLLGCALAYVIFPLVCVFVASGKGRASEAVTNTPFLGVLQNGIAGFAIVVLVAVLPLEIMAAPGLIFLALVSVAFLFSRKLPKALFPLKLNATHLKDRKKVLYEKGLSAQRLEDLRRLSRHLQRQGVLTAFSLMPWFLAVGVGRYSRSKDVFKHRMMDEFMLRLPSREMIVLFSELLPMVDIDCANDLAKLGDDFLG